MKKRFFLVSLIISVVGIILFGLISTNTYYNNSIEYTKEVLVVYMEQYDESIYSCDETGAKEFSEKLKGARVTFFNISGDVISDSDVSNLTENHKDRKEVSDAIKNGEGFDVRNSTSTSVKLIYYCIQVNDNLLVRIAVPTSSLWKIFSESIPSLLQFLLISSLFMAFISWIAVDYILKPVEKISRDAALGKNISSKYHELQPIINTINTNNMTINKKIENIKENKRVENIVLDNMEHGIIILNDKSDIVLMNNSAYNILGVSRDIVKLNFFELDQEIDSCLKEKNSSVFSRHIGDSDYDIRLTFTDNASVFLITDVTEIKKAERSKNDFIANITHEMNTPLTSIKGFAELISHDALDKSKMAHAGEVILKQSNRLSLLIKNIINYSSFENNDLPNYNVNVSEILNSILINFEGAMVDKKITLYKDIKDNIIINSRTERVLEVITNLVTNAIKYNKTDGFININLDKINDEIILVVKDSGIGIAKENYDKIFDRFFTVDKSHNEYSSGFGLGLAIVKKICKQSGWKIEVSSKLGEGTEFKLILK